MNPYFDRAWVRPPGARFAEGITSIGGPPPDLALALAQHRAYCAALAATGVAVTVLPPDDMHPDATFVEDVAVVVPGLIVLTRPGAESRRGEVDGIRAAFAAFPWIVEIGAPGTLDGGDVCQAGRRFFIGISERTNEAGARQLAAALTAAGFDCVLMDIRGTAGLLHLKSGLAWLGASRLAVAPPLAERSEWKGFEVAHIAAADAYAANCIRVRDTLLMAAGYPAAAAILAAGGCSLVELDVSEFQKMDGGLSCLSIRL